VFDVDFEKPIDSTTKTDLISLDSCSNIDRYSFDHEELSCRIDGKYPSM